MKTIPVRQLRRPPTEPDSTDHFTIRDVGHLLGGKDMVQELHRHDHFLLLALANGKGRHEVDFVSYPVRDHVLFFMRPGHVHRLTLKAGSTGYLMQFRADFYSPGDKAARQVLRKAGNEVLFQLDAERFKRILAVLDPIFREYTDKQQGYPEVVRAYLGILFLELVRRAPGNAQPAGSTSPYVQERFDELLELIETHVSSTKQVSAYAEMMHLSTYQLNAITKASLDRSCSELINERIILEAKRYLLATSQQVNQVADHLGYEDVSYFIRFFKKRTGLSPEAFRQKSR